MLFEIHAERNANDKKIFFYDNETNILKSEDGHVYEFTQDPANNFQYAPEPYTPFDKDHPLKKSKLITTIKIQLG